MHLHWALGGRLGLPSDVDLFLDARLLAANLLAIPLCFGCALICLKLATMNSRPSRRWLWGIVAAAAFCLLHSVPPLASALFRLSTEPSAERLSEREFYALLIYEPYWLMGGLLLLATAVTSFPGRRLDCENVGARAR